ncbi:MAG: hypothetical protein AAF721_10030 [Myxococcota bacterium]
MPAKDTSRRSQRRLIIVATLAGAIAVGLGGWVALILTERTNAASTQASPPPAAAANVND